MRTRINRRLIRRLGTDSHSRLVWAQSVSSGGGATGEGSVAAGATGAGGDRLSLGAATPLGEGPSNLSAVSPRSTDSDSDARRALTRAPPTIAALAAPVVTEDDDCDAESDGNRGSGDDASTFHVGVRAGYLFEIPKDDSLRPVSSMPTPQALRDAAILGRKLNAASRASLARLTRAGEVTARLEQRWGSITTLDLSHAFIPGESLNG